jgi:hypothetical protein
VYGIVLLVNLRANHRRMVAESRISNARDPEPR